MDDTSCLNSAENQINLKSLGEQFKEFFLNFFQILPIFMHPKSYGYMKLSNKNPFNWPRFYPNYLSDAEDHDVKAYVVAIREVQRIMAKSKMARYNAKIVSTKLPGEH